MSEFGKFETVMADVDSPAPECKIFQEAYYKLSQGITHPEVLAGMLWSRNLITLVERQAAEQVSAAAHHRTIALLNTMGAKIQLQPEKLYEFVKILESEPSLVHLARLLDPSKALATVVFYPLLVAKS